MRIGFDAKRAFNNRTGLGNYSRFVLNALLKYAPEYDYLAYTPKIKAGFFEEFLPKNVRNAPYQNALQQAWWRSIGMVKDLQKDRIEVFHGLSNELPSGLKKAGIKSVVTIHDLIFLRYPELYPAIDRFFYRQKFKKACEIADVIVAVSEQTKRDIIEFYDIAPHKIQVVYQDCHEVFHQAQPPSSQILKIEGISKPYILSVGTIEARKNQLQLVKAFCEAQLPDAQLILVGAKTPYQQKIEAYIAQHHLEGSIKILNKIAFLDLPVLYQAAHIFVYPSLFEGFGIPIVEALHSGIPVIAATGSCLEEAGGSGAVYFDPHHTDELAQKLQLLWNDESLGQQLVKQGQEHIKQFSAENIAQKLINLYQSR
ncbi:MAG: glycosyltransferase family 1 protein [Spirosomataceae bacterium]